MKKRTTSYLLMVVLGASLPLVILDTAVAMGPGGGGMGPARKFTLRDRNGNPIITDFRSGFNRHSDITLGI